MYNGNLATAAHAALLYEVKAEPKPGLVDPSSNGAHTDMDVQTFIKSADSLQDYFSAASQLGENWQGHDLTALFTALRPLGVDAEKTMFAATNNVNTHKGAIFSLGILVTATAYVRSHKNLVYSLASIQSVVQHMMVGITKKDLAPLKAKQNMGDLTAGERQFLQYGKSGIRGEAEAGFPNVFELALPYFQQLEGTLNERLLDTLLYVSGHISDSNLIKRAGTVDVLLWWQTEVAEYFARGGSRNPEGLNYLVELDQRCISRNLSIGGSADLLILTAYLAIISDELSMTQ